MIDVEPLMLYITVAFHLTPGVYSVHVYNVLYYVCMYVCMFEFLFF